jgi:hypothetical protein
VAIIGLASAEIQDALWSLGYLLRWVCSKELFVEEIPRMRVIAAKVVCKLEKAYHIQGTRGEYFHGMVILFFLLQ